MDKEKGDDFILCFLMSGLSKRINQNQRCNSVKKSQFITQAAIY